MVLNNIAMKKQILSVASLAVIAASALSCSQELDTQKSGDPGKAVTIGVDIPMTKTHLGEQIDGLYKVCWSAGDAVSVNGVTSEALSEEHAGQASASFTVPGVDAPYGIVYPASACTAADGTALTLNIPAEQKYTADTFAEGANILYGFSNTENTGLKHLTGIYKLGLKAIKGANSSRVKRIEIISNSEEAPIAGEFTLDVETGELAPSAGATSTISLVVLNSSGNSTYKAILSTAYTYFHIAVPAGEYSEGFTINVYDYSNSKMTGVWKPNKDTDGCLEAGAMKKVEALLKPAYRAIATETDLRDFVIAANANQHGAFINPESGAVELAGDIVCTGDSPISRITTAWEGIFDGKGYTITYADNLEYRSLFTHIAEDGVLKNLTIAGNTDRLVVWTVFKPWGTDAKSKTHMTFAVKNYGTIENCHSKVDINLENTKDGSSSCNIYIAGICGFNAGLIKGCSNQGDITVVSNNGAGRHCRVAGISLTSADGMYTAAQYGKEDEPSTDNNLCTILTETDGKFEDCTNSGTLSVTNNTGSRLNGFQLAGIVANIPAGTPEAYAEVINCHNTADLSYVEPTYSTSLTGSKIVGGVVGCVGVHYVGEVTFGEKEYQAPMGNVGFPALITGSTNTGVVTAGCYSESNTSIPITDTNKYSQVFVGGVVAYAHGQGSQYPVTIEGCVNQGGIVASSRNMNGHIVGGIVGGAKCAALSGCYAKQTYDNYADVSGTGVIQSGAFGGLVGVTYDDITLTGCKAFSDITFCYSNAYPSIQGSGDYNTLTAGDIGASKAPTRVNSIKACGFLVAGCPADKTITVSDCAVGGTGDFYLSSSPKKRVAVVLDENSDMTSSSNAACDRYILENSRLSGTIGYWDGTMPEAAN